MYVPLDDVVAEALSIVGDDQDKEMLKLLARQWAWRAVLKLPVSDDNIKVCKIEAKNLFLKKPSDMRRYLDMALYDANGGYLHHVYHKGQKRIYPDFTRFPTASNSNNPPQCDPVDLSEDAHAFYIGTNGSDVSYALVRYFAYPLDNRGMPMIREEDVLTCVYFIRLCASQKKNNNRSEIAQNKEFYDQEADIQRARRKSVISEDEKRTLTSIMNRMIPDFQKKTF